MIHCLVSYQSIYFPFFLHLSVSLFLTSHASYPSLHPSVTGHLLKAKLLSTSGTQRKIRHCLCSRRTFCLVDKPDVLDDDRTTHMPLRSALCWDEPHYQLEETLQGFIRENDGRISHPWRSGRWPPQRGLRKAFGAERKRRAQRSPTSQ